MNLAKSGHTLANRISGTTIFGDNSPDIATIFSAYPCKKYRLNEVIFTSLNLTKFIFYLIDGKVKITNVSDKGRLVSSGYYQQGNFINLKAITDNSKKKSFAISKSKNTIAISIPQNEFLQKLNLFPALHQNVFKQLLADKAESEQRIHRILDIKSNERVYDFLYHHTLNFGERIGYEYVIRDPLTHQEIGEYIGSSRQTVTTSMNFLRKKGILHFNRKYWIIRDLGQLKAIVDAL